jgi:hypothetical protein
MLQESSESMSVAMIVLTTQLPKEPITEELERTH